MNFDFLKDLRGLGYVYENCSNAEKLAMTMPVQSVFTARKSAELLAKFIFLTAHNEQMESMDFVDVLGDPAVRDFIKDRKVMNAFHYIRKSGNRAVHGNDEETVEEALDVLSDLHYVAGETACMLGLIKSYPDFDDKIEHYPDAKFIDEQDIEEKAQKMFLEYVEEFNAQQERDKYIEMKDYDWFSYSIEGNVEMHEYLKFEYKPKQIELIEYLQRYLVTLHRLSIERSPEKAEERELSYPVTLNAKIIIEGHEYNSCNAETFVDAITRKLPEANDFIIDVECSGALREFFNDEFDENGDGRINMILKDAVWTGAGMLDTLQQYKRRNPFEYKLSVFYPDSGECRYEKITKGKDVDVLSICDERIVDQKFDEEWWSYSLNLVLGENFDIVKNRDVLTKLQNIVRTNIPKSEVPYCESIWEDDETLYILCPCIQWNCTCLREVQDFLDRLNEVLLPIKDEIEPGADGTWEIKNRFAVATWEWTDKGFKVKGTIF